VPVLRGDELARLQAATEYLAGVVGEIREAVSRIAQQPSTPATAAKETVVQAPQVEALAQRPAVQTPDGEPNHALIEGWRHRLNDGEQRILELFSQISMNWRGRPLVSHEVVVELIAATRTSSGLRVQAELDAGAYPLGVRVSDRELAAVPLTRHDWQGNGITPCSQSFPWVFPSLEGAADR